MLRGYFLEAVPDPAPAPVPEPATVLLLGAGLGALGLMKKKHSDLTAAPPHLRRCEN
ncbi:PEP-CTERM sorting domain-containing protein [Geobacter sulfurreducens]|uniref:PEP-CTERM sorting domain-containing protein n=1 Tax=Geobacter sulfurreducens TaxID=35554 RepID=UPI000E655D3B